MNAADDKDRTVIRLKCRYENEIHSVIITPQSSFAEVKKRLSNDFGFEVTLKYEDKEGDFINMTSQNDLNDLFLYNQHQSTINVLIAEAISLPLLTKAKAPQNNVQPLLSRDWSRSNMPLSTAGSGMASANRAPPRPADRFPSISDKMQAESNSIRWKRGEILGQGAFGIVYLGLNIDTGELMAVKQMATEEVSRKEMSSLENEINLLRNLRHPNIVRYIGTELSSSALSIFLEYVPGGSLKALIDKFGALEESVAKSYTRQLLLGLEYLHRNGIAHRDIKGANCLVGNDGVIKLADFGSSKHWRPSPTTSTAPSTCSGDIKGTPSWMAPEVVREQGDGISWKKADIWSLACTTLEMTTGKPPWTQFNNSVTILYHLACQETLPEYPSPASTELITFLNICFQRDPAYRPDVTSLLLHPFVASTSSLLWGQPMLRPTTMSSMFSSTGDNNRDLNRELYSSSGHMRGQRSSHSNSNALLKRSVDSARSRQQQPSISPALSSATEGSSVVFPVVAPQSARLAISAPLLSARLPRPDSARTESTPRMHHPLSYPPMEEPELAHELEVQAFQSLSASPSGGYLSDFTAVEADSLRNTPDTSSLAPLTVPISPSRPAGKSFRKGRRPSKRRASDGKRSGKAGGQSKKAPSMPVLNLLDGEGKGSVGKKSSAGYESDENSVENTSLLSALELGSMTQDDQDDNNTINSSVYMDSNKDSIVRDWSVASVGTSEIPPLVQELSMVPIRGFDYSDPTLSAKQLPTISVESWQQVTPLVLDVESLSKQKVSLPSPMGMNSRGKRTAKSAKHPTTHNAGANGDLMEISCDSLESLQVSGKRQGMMRSSIEKRGTNLDYNSALIPVATSSSQYVYDSAERISTSIGKDTISNDNASVEVPLYDIEPILYNEHALSITRLRTATKQPNVLLSSSLDGSVVIYPSDPSQKVILDMHSFNVKNTERKVSLGNSSLVESPDANNNASTSSRSIRVLDMWTDEHMDYIYAACSDSFLRIYNDYRAHRLIKGHEDVVSCVQGLEGNHISSSYALLASGSVDRTVRMWDIRAKKPQVFLFRGHGDSVITLRWMEGGRALVSAGKDKTIRIWDTRAGRLRSTVEKHFGSVHSLRVLPEVSSLTGASSTPSAAFVSAARDSMLCFYSGSGDCVSSHTTAHRGQVTTLSDVLQVNRPHSASLVNLYANTLSSKSAYSYSSGFYMLSSGADNAIKVWDLKKMKSIAEVTSLTNSSIGGISRLVWCKGGIVVGSSSGALRYLQQSSAGNNNDGNDNSSVTGGKEKDKEYAVYELASFSPHPSTASGTMSSAGNNTTAGVTDMVTSPSLLACASKTGQILRWNLG